VQAYEPEDWLDCLATQSVGDVPSAHVLKLEGLLAAHQASSDDLRAQFIAEKPSEGLHAFNPAEASVEVADAVFDLLADEEGQSPFVCPGAWVQTPPAAGRWPGGLVVRATEPRGSGIRAAGGPAEMSGRLPGAHAVPASVAAAPGAKK
jgi:hypothetical protein